MKHRCSLLQEDHSRQKLNARLYVLYLDSVLSQHWIVSLINVKTNGLWLSFGFTSVAIVILTDSRKSARNRCVIDPFWSVFQILKTLPHAGAEVFVISMSKTGTHRAKQTYFVAIKYKLKWFFSVTRYSVTDIGWLLMLLIVV